MTRLNDYVKVAEAALILGISENMLSLRTNGGKMLSRQKPTKRYRLFRRSDLERFLEQVADDKTKPKS